MDPTVNASSNRQITKPTAKQQQQQHDNSNNTTHNNKVYLHKQVDRIWMQAEVLLQGNMRL